MNKALWIKLGVLIQELMKNCAEDLAKWVHILELVLDGKNPYPTKRDWKVWKTIEVGIHACKCGITQMLSACVVGSWAKDIMNQAAFVLSSTKRSLELVVISVGEMGFPKGATYKEICDWALANGLDLCPAEVGPYLRAQYVDQPKDEWLIIAMEAINGSERGLGVFIVGHDGGGLYLHGPCISPGDFWDAVNRFVFVRCK